MQSARTAPTIQMQGEQESKTKLQELYQPSRCRAKQELKPNPLQDSTNHPDAGRSKNRKRNPLQELNPDAEVVVVVVVLVVVVVVVVAMVAVEC